VEDKNILFDCAFVKGKKSYKIDTLSHFGHGNFGLDFFFDRRVGSLKNGAKMFDLDDNNYS